MTVAVNPGLFLLFMKEEYRAQTSMFKSPFLMYAAFIFIVSAIRGLMILPMKSALTAFELISLAHLGVLIAGMFVGGMAMFQDQILERMMGSVRLLLGTPGTLPIKYKEMFAYFYVKDILYYILMNVLPVLFGLYASTLVTGVHINLPLAVITFITAFITGVSLTFAFSAIFVRSKMLLAPVIIGILALIYVIVTGASSPLTALGETMPFATSYANGTPGGILISLAVFAMLSILSLVLIKEKSQAVEKMYPDRFTGLKNRLGAFGRYSSLAAKEWIDLARSGALGTVLFSFVFPLLFLWGLLWLLSSVLNFINDGSLVQLEFNIMFYSVVIGFFSTEVYGWLNNLDSTANYKTLPISMPDVIKSKLILFAGMNTAVSVAYLTLICLSRNELSLLPYALYTMFMVSAYVGVFTAYTTGVFTNSLMFDYKVLVKYAIIVVPVLIAMVFMTFNVSMLIPLVVSATVLGVVAYWLLGKIDNKWERTEFRM